MRPTIVRLPNFDRNDEHIYLLNWLGMVRRTRQRLEIFARFVPEDARAPRSRAYDCWVRLTDFPFLILGSRWYRGVMVGKPGNMRSIRIRDTTVIKVHSLSITPKRDALCLGDAYRLAFDRPASPIAEFADDDDVRVFVPISELYRSHYLGIPRAQASILHGLHRGGIDNPSFAAWDPELTSWSSQQFRIARIAPARFLQINQAAYLARILFSDGGQRTLDKLHGWFLKHFLQNKSAYEALSPRLLPIPELPYSQARWEASTIALSSDQDGRSRILVTHIERFDATEPYLSLECVEPKASKAAREDVNGIGARGQGELLAPVVGNSVTNTDPGWDLGLAPIAVASISTIDEAARRRVVMRVPRDLPPSVGVGARIMDGTVSTQMVSTEAYGPSHSGVAPLLFSTDEPWPERDASLDASYDAIRRACHDAVNRHLELGIDSQATFMPDERHAYAFDVRHRRTPKRHSTGRQFVIALVRLGAKHALVIEPQRRMATEAIPLGIVWRTGLHAYGAIDLVGIREIVRHLEDALSKGRSWTRLTGLDHELNAKSVWHPVVKRGANTRFATRILARLNEAIGDIRIATSR